MTLKQAEELWREKKINVFDLTHIWPHADFPLREIGKLTLNENAKVRRLNHRAGIVLTSRTTLPRLSRSPSTPRT